MFQDQLPQRFALLGGHLCNTVAIDYRFFSLQLDSSSSMCSLCSHGIHLSRFSVNVFTVPSSLAFPSTLTPPSFTRGKGKRKGLLLLRGHFPVGDTAVLIILRLCVQTTDRCHTLLDISRPQSLKEMGTREENTIELERRG